uniref:Ribosomal protein S19 n=1 Tax=Skeletonema marinoi TaxID=267567 RepID=A0A0S2M9Z3_9STRA|nr:ribosomal protein S19 [Skeletonema marinoi]ALO71452.1 ribosomal protein S19 [Skeletonema marinoi]
MSRVKWKDHMLKNKLLDNIKNSISVYKNDIKTAYKSSVILPKFIGLTIQVYNGKAFITIKIVEEMVGHKLGEFVLTRKQFSYKKKKKKQK